MAPWTHWTDRHLSALTVKVVEAISTKLSVLRPPWREMEFGNGHKPNCFPLMLWKQPAVTQNWQIQFLPWGMIAWTANITLYKQCNFKKKKKMVVAIIINILSRAWSDKKNSTENKNSSVELMLEAHQRGRGSTDWLNYLRKHVYWCGFKCCQNRKCRLVTCW